MRQNKNILQQGPKSVSNSKCWLENSVAPEATSFAVYSRRKIHLQFLWTSCRDMRSIYFSRFWFDVYPLNGSSEARGVSWDIFLGEGFVVESNMAAKLFRQNPPDEIS